MNEYDAYHSAIDELVEDEGKIVTYKLLSHQLALPVNKAKEVLQDYLTINENGQLNATYSLTGRCQGKISVSIVACDKLDEAKSKMDSVLSCHVYSVQKANLIDPTPLYNADYDLTKSLMFKCASFSMIRYNGAKQLSEEEIQNLHISTLTKQAEGTSAPQAKETPHTEKSSKKDVKSFFAPKPTARAQKDDQIHPKQNNEVEKSGGESNPVNDSPALTKPSKRKGMELFMTKGKSDLFETHKQTAKNPPMKNNNAKPPTPPPQNGSADISLNEAELLELSEKMEVDDFDINEMKKSPEAKEKSNPKVSKSKSLSKKTKKSSSKTSKVPTKRRKRIRELSSSSSSSESEEDFDNIDVIPPSPEALPPLKVNDALKNPRKKRVLKSRTYIDEEGSMLTEKVWEEVSCSSEEDEKDNVAKENKSPAEVKTVLKKPASFKGKQSTLMGFFNKKS